MTVTVSVALALNLELDFGLTSIIQFVHVDTNTSIPPASAQLNATQIAVMKGSHWRIWMVGPEILFSTYQWFFWRFIARSGSIQRVLAQLTLPQRGCVGQTAGPEVAPPSVVNGHNCTEVCSVGSGISSAASRYYCEGKR